MAKDTSSVGELQVSKCYFESGRKRHRISASVSIPFEASHPAVNINQGNVDDQSIDDTSDSEEEVIAQGEAPIVDDDDDEYDFEGVTEMDLADDVAFIESLVPAEPDDLSTDGLFDPGMDDDDFDDLDDDLGDNTGHNTVDEGGPPRVSTWRLNLTALSQVYNIYMAAYSDKIYVSRPRSCVTNSLPAEPDLILQPPASAMGIEIGGYLDRILPHQVNHMIVGDLGDEEIMLLAYDDGDVIGYYTRTIEKELLRREREGRDNDIIPEPFFHENVGKSAWGLAVHKQSRIIAVGSNSHNVCVFVFALTGKSYRHNPLVDSVEFFRNVAKDTNGDAVEWTNDRPLPYRGTNPGRKKSLEKVIRRRDANWRIILEIGREGSNIPNVAFGSDNTGEADKIVAIGICGCLWIMDIWQFEPFVKIDDIYSACVMARLNYNYNKPRSWGVLVLPESSFLPAADYTDALGVDKDNIRYVSNEKIGNWLDISKGIKNVKNNSPVHPWLRWDKISRFSFNPVEQHRTLLNGGSWVDFKTHQMKIPDSSAEQESQLGKTGVEYMEDPKTILTDGSSIMRTHELDIELRSFEEGGTGIMFEKVISQSRPPNAVIPAMRVSHERLANLIHVPELSLVVAGSLCGRVALVTLTRPPKGFPFKRGFKVEAILPLKRDEDNEVRPICPLLGVAVGPVPFSGNVERASGPVGRRRYRVMLQYYDLTILSYEISRNSLTDPLSII
ncbi:uncharacterized protein F4812DRAFT_425130 [Daldinia caldariorum]|uniref:uncharacterized protein n=1 Tax=Daldinia caldariorum TaxID=326644 RepID=UPI00200806CE|nr:uncharacterized protein F4812DRAFT_425130 [Daldinia caldariorum]KAI1468904.1 hypothetical protein F4812DRAFT_425130 [Daldinia caldariorum]